MRFRLYRAGLAALLVLAACSANPAPGASATIAPPKRIGGDNPFFGNIRPTGDSRTEITVMVSEDGRPDMTSLRLAGSGVSTYRDVITDWIARSMFEPGRSNGVPVRAQFRTQLQIKVARR